LITKSREFSYCCDLFNGQAYRPYKSNGTLFIYFELTAEYTVCNFWQYRAIFSQNRLLFARRWEGERNKWWQRDGNYILQTTQ